MSLNNGARCPVAEKYEAVLCVGQFILGIEIAIIDKNQFPETAAFIAATVRAFADKFPIQCGRMRRAKNVQGGLALCEFI
ncbi:hypothetical protein [Burkholderia paludis]|uniref:hypothetical protein n=1 Tax=Burkholderia paludis TaxID=1506587 RepID=UPI00126A688F|nr:hypothetical protein [Burkholderia paludis]